MAERDALAETRRRRGGDLGSERQQILMFHDEAVRQHDQILDVFAAVERLHALDAEGLRKSASRGGKGGGGGALTFVLPRGPGKPTSKAPAERLLRALPTHLMACLLGRLPAGAGSAAVLSATADLRDKSPEAHLGEGLRLLAALCDMATRTPGLVHVLEDEEFRQQAVDLALLVLVSMAGPDVDDCLRAAASPTKAGGEEALRRAELVPAALGTLTAGAGPPATTPDGVTIVRGAGGPAGHFEGLALRLLGMPASEPLLDALFDAVRTVIRMVREALLNPGSAVDVYLLAFQAGIAMEVLAEMAATPLFYHRLLLHDAGASAPLRLIRSALALHDPPLAQPPWVRGPRDRLQPAGRPADITTARGEGAAELLAARGAALLMMLAEAEDPGFLDSVAAAPRPAVIARDIAARLAQSASATPRVSASHAGALVLSSRHWHRRFRQRLSDAAAVF